MTDLLDDPKARAITKRTFGPYALATALSAEDAFWTHARRVSSDPALRSWFDADATWATRFQPTHSDIAFEVAAPYWRAHAGRRVVAVFLRAAGAALMRDPQDRTLAVLSMGGLASAVWDAGSPLAEGDEPNRPGERFFDLLCTGARVVARRGAGRCTGCDLGPPLAIDRRRDGQRPLYCSSCDLDRGALRAGDEHAASELLKRCRYLLGHDPIDMSSPGRRLVQQPGG